MFEWKLGVKSSILILRHKILVKTETGPDLSKGWLGRWVGIQKKQELSEFQAIFDISEIWLSSSILSLDYKILIVIR